MGGLLISNFFKEQETPLDSVTIEADDTSHIHIKDEKTCLEECENKPCTYYCPTRVFSWAEEKNKINIDYTRCIECLACPHGCPHDNISWQFPQGGYGVDYQN